MITHQTPEQILQAATPEQKIIWNYLYLRFGERIAVSQYYYQGSPINEITTYSANKLFFALQLSVGGAYLGAQPAFITLYDENNAVSLYQDISLQYWDATAAALRFVNGSGQYNNLVFSRLSFTGATVFQFVGYRITI